MVAGPKAAEVCFSLWMRLLMTRHGMNSIRGWSPMEVPTTSAMTRGCPAWIRTRCANALDGLKFELDALHRHGRIIVLIVIRPVAFSQFDLLFERGATFARDDEFLRHRMKRVRFQPSAFHGEDRYPTAVVLACHGPRLQALCLFLLERRCRLLVVEDLQDGHLLAAFPLQGEVVRWLSRAFILLPRFAWIEDDILAHFVVVERVANGDSEIHIAFQSDLAEWVAWDGAVERGWGMYGSIAERRAKQSTA
mmetsp:Transcript_19876/g.55277  ORF Transcript_19876/g.55277 Transcript_19876/m.55277 type:complete len:250 (-) Transcript_19876:237-986(-)